MLIKFVIYIFIIKLDYQYIPYMTRIIYPYKCLSYIPFITMVTSITEYNIFIRLTLPDKSHDVILFLWTGLFCTFHIGMSISSWKLKANIVQRVLWVRISLRWGVHDTTLCDKVCQWLTAGRWFSPGTPVSSINKSDHHDITEILLKVVINTIILNLSHW